MPIENPISYKSPGTANDFDPRPIVRAVACVGLVTAGLRIVAESYSFDITLPLAVILLFHSRPFRRAGPRVR